MLGLFRRCQDDILRLKAQERILVFERSLVVLDLPRQERVVELIAAPDRQGTAPTAAMRIERIGHRQLAVAASSPRLPRLHHSLTAFAASCSDSGWNIGARFRILDPMLSRFVYRRTSSSLEPKLIPN